MQPYIFVSKNPHRKFTAPIRRHRKHSYAICKSEKIKIPFDYLLFPLTSLLIKFSALNEVHEKTSTPHTCTHTHMPHEKKQLTARSINSVTAAVYAHIHTLIRRISKIQLNALSRLINLFLHSLAHTERASRANLKTGQSS